MKIIFLLTGLFFFHNTFAQTGLGIFDKAADIGNPKNAGSSTYDAATQTYHMRGSGYNIWFNRDEFQYLYKKVGGDFIVTGDFQFEGGTGNAHRKFGWMLRENTDEAAASVNAVVHGDGLTVLQWRPLRGAYMRDPEDEAFYAKKAVFRTIQLERVGKKITMRVANLGEPLQEVTTQEMPYLKDSVLIGAFLTSHDSADVQTCKVWNVRIDKPAPPTWHPNPQIKLPPLQGVMGSRLEIINEQSIRMVVYESAGNIEAPAWLPGTNKLSFNNNGTTFSVTETGDSASRLIGRVSAMIKKKPGSKSSVEEYIYYSKNRRSTSQIWRMKKDSTTDEQVTFDEYHNYSPHLSPDGRWIVFISFPTDVEPNAAPRYSKAMLRIMPAAGGAPRVFAYLYGGSGSLAENPWSADSKKIAFVSYSGVR